MIKARLSCGRLVLGITEDNVERLKQGYPLLVRHEEVGDTTGNIIIVYGFTLEQIKSQLEPFITNETAVTPSNS